MFTEYPTTEETIETQEANNKIHELISKRRSLRAFSDRPVDRDTLEHLFEAARWAPSSYNEQPWQFIVATKEQPGRFRLLFDCLKEANQKWAGNAPVLMLTLAKAHFSRNNKPNRHAYHDVGLAMGNFILQATYMDLYVHQMAGFDVETARKNLQIPEEFDPVAIVAIGYLGDPEKLPEELRKREMAPRKRKELEELLFSGVWGNPF